MRRLPARGKSGGTWQRKPFRSRLIANLLPEPEATGLLALLLLHESRSAARTDSRGDLIPLEEQDRTLWDRELIAEGIDLVRNL